MPFVEDYCRLPDTYDFFLLLFFTDRYCGEVLAEPKSSPESAGYQKSFLKEER